MVDPNAPVWLMRLSAQPNLFAGNIPYVPIPLEEVDEYTKSTDYEDDCVKTIETIGILRPVNPRVALLVTMPDSPKRKLRLALDNFDSKYLHPENTKEHASELRDAWKVVRVFGLLGTRNKKVVLEVEICERVDEPESAIKLLKILSGMARRRMSMYIYENHSRPQLNCGNKMLEDCYEETINCYDETPS